MEWPWHDWCPLHLHFTFDWISYSVLYFHAIVGLAGLKLGLYQSNNGSMSIDMNLKMELGSSASFNPIAKSLFIGRQILATKIS